MVAGQAPGHSVESWPGIVRSRWGQEQGKRQDQPHVEVREGASTTQVPPFALFGLFSSESRNAPRANNAKSGTSQVEARSAKRYFLLTLSLHPESCIP